MTPLIPFSYQDRPVRVVTIDDEPWFVATDITPVLGYQHGPSAIRRLEDDEHQQIAYSLVDPTVRPGFGPQTVTVVSESGIYSLILWSQKEEAKPFRRWITSEVIPSIRRHGGYLTPAKVEEVLSDPDTIIRLATDLKRERAARAALEIQAAADAPKVLFADAVAASETTILIGELAKILRGNGVHIGQQRLFAELRRDGYLIRREGSDWNTPTQRSMELGLFRVKQTAITHSDGHVTVSKTTKVTGKGQRYFVDRYLAKEGAAA